MKLKVEIASRDDHLQRCSRYTKPSTREIEIQTDADWELWDEMVQAHHVYKEMLQREEFEDFEFPMVNLNILPEKIRANDDGDMVEDVFHYTN